MYPLYPWMRGRTTIIGNAVRSNFFAHASANPNSGPPATLGADLPAVPRDRHRFIYASSPLRGIERLVRMFARIRKALPDATLEVFMHNYNVDVGASDAERYKP